MQSRYRHFLAPREPHGPAPARARSACARPGPVRARDTDAVMNGRPRAGRPRAPERLMSLRPVRFLPARLEPRHGRRVCALQLLKRHLLHPKSNRSWASGRRPQGHRREARWALKLPTCSHWARWEFGAHVPRPLQPRALGEAAVSRERRAPIRHAPHTRAHTSHAHLTCGSGLELAMLHMESRPCEGRVRLGGPTPLLEIFACIPRQWICPVGKPHRGNCTGAVAATQEVGWTSGSQLGYTTRRPPNDRPGNTANPLPPRELERPSLTSATVRELAGEHSHQQFPAVASAACHNGTPLLQGIPASW